MTQQEHQLEPVESPLLGEDPADEHVRQPSRTRKGTVAGLAAIAVLVSCEGAQTDPPGHFMTDPSPQATTSAAPGYADGDILQAGVLRGKRQNRELTPDSIPLPNPKLFRSGQHLGAVVINLQPNVARPWATVEAYYHSKGLTMPKHPNNPWVHRIVADTPTSKTIDESLANGVVLDRSSSEQKLVMALHDVTPVHAGVKVNGKTYEQTQMGINAPVVAGDTLTWMQPSKTPGQVNTFVFEAGDSRIVQASSDKAANDMFVADGNELDTYECWPAGSADQRRVTDWKLVQTYVQEGSVRFVGGIGPIGPNR